MKASIAVVLLFAIMATLKVQADRNKDVSEEVNNLDATQLQKILKSLIDKIEEVEASVCFWKKFI
ncbi:hypothetical protein TrispH2_005542 [Trichoplax sp. H2]|nr:hypothetical protein TrispH2_005542 [Trichoplax sp. H2]|eukprot:RDD41151.1 hypothetical protein TrispH2_005542 [Trichoplax sp. H2]